MYQLQNKEKVLRLMEGAYDLHTHTAPDFFPRALDDFKLMEQADRYKMAGVMLKNHLDPTPARAILANTQGYKAKAYGSAVMNLSIGGLNPIAAQKYLELGAKIIWMPTIHSRNQIEYSKIDNKIQSAGIRLLDDNGYLKPEVLEILDLIKEYKATVATGHISIGESIAVCTAARERGIKTILTHPDWACTMIPIEIQKLLVSKGVIVEKLWFDVGLNLISAEYMAQTIKELGPENCFMATDRGQAGMEFPAEGLMMFMDAMLEQGLSYEQVYCMTHENPAKIIG
ncbi:DUF6282 family protein [Enterocloster lavalensis]|uniref:DUF6282 family protein n=1 Tax=Enterocloster lavalensis TaxID=460384 RepID=UPI0023F4C16F|nr:DUF6282 family protein [Enterocloster lavalensis]